MRRARTILLLCVVILNKTFVNGQGLKSDGITDIMSVDGINKRLIEVLEQLRILLPTGYPELGVPALDPWSIPSITYNLQETSLNLKFEAQGVNISNARKFQVIRLETTVRPLVVKINMKIPTLKVTADRYNIQGTMMMLFPIRANGRLEMNLSDVDLLLTIMLDPLEPSIEDLTIYLTVGKVQAKLSGASGLVNTLLSQHGAEIINGKKEEISVAARNQLVPPLNEYLATLKTDYLLTLIQR